MWLDICFENRDALVKALDTFAGIVLEMRKAIEENDRQALWRLLGAAESLRKEF
jgi:prephenate dehydrogenase